LKIEESEMDEEDKLSSINEYLRSLDGISEYVIILEGFPIYWGRILSKARLKN
jgi:hypothetical protein